ncbi:FecR domain-containing protein [Fulvivirgaceae bacterium BMA12]|uniref:FecR domain-containing protein n=1 Tax=Agaribacillus aureus TaxID=3051825 RepID=A0ABT8LHY4_9BACT|nr:FecR domain-containing protein [Fulvivirgaceae bacterium BMA12]
MRYKNFDVDHFVNDDKFREWVLNPSPEINYFWEKWLLQNPEKEVITNQAREIVLMVGSRKKLSREKHKKKVWEKIEQTNLTFDKQNKSDDNRKVQPLYQYEGSRDSFHKSKRLRIYISIVAGVTLLIAAINLLKLNSETVTEPVANVVVKSNPSGQKSELRLPDGSMVYLNAESSLQYVEGFQGDRRELYLQGEAFFEVAKDSLHPFTVVTQNLTTTALGTSFNIQAYKNEAQIKVALVSGKVIVSDTANQSSMTLTPGEGVILKRGSQKMIRNNLDIEKTLFWKNRTIYFEDTDFQEAVDYLERWYGVSISLSNYTQRSLTCSGKFHNKSLQFVLKTLGFALNFDYEINKKKVNIMFKSN